MCDAVSGAPGVVADPIRTDATEVAAGTIGSASACLTICTATYDRAALLPRVYESLVRQVGGVSFEWLVVDDGSTDNTGSLVRGWIEDGEIPIRYVWQHNSGKHVALNAAFRLARGTLFAIVDSDDWLVEDAVAAIWEAWDGIPFERRDAFSGVAALCRDERGGLVGEPFPAGEADFLPLDLFHRRRLQGDKWFAQRTELLRAHPFPVYPGERFLSEGAVWDRIGARYRMRALNRALQVVEYQTAGLSARSLELRSANPVGAAGYYAALASYPLPLPLRLRACTNHVRFRLHARARGSRARDWPYSALLLGALPLGTLAYLHDRWRLWRRR